MGGIPSNPWGRKWQGRKRRDKIWNTFSVPSGTSCSGMLTLQSRIVIGNAVWENRVGINAAVTPIQGGSLFQVICRVKMDEVGNVLQT